MDVDRAAPSPTEPSPDAKRSRPLSEWVDDRQLAEHTPISRSEWQKLRREKSGPRHYKVGRRVIYRWAEVEAWLESDRVAP
jgi:predicted DNA-binding transcriptional regulator AlpA